jgi:signal transduction histidine kinase
MSYSPNGVDPDGSYQALSDDSERVFCRGWLQPRVSVTLRYGLALVSVSAAFVLARTFVNYHLPQSFTALALSAVASTFWYGGTKPGILAALISWLVRDYLSEPEVSVESRTLYGLVFLVFALVMTLVMRGRNGLEARIAGLRQLESDLAHMNRLGMMGELAASLAHEITQPIASARNNARAALIFLNKQQPDLGEVGEALGCIVGDADRAGDIIDRIRDHIKKAPPRKAFFDLNAAINEVVELARTSIIKNSVSVQTRLANGLFPVQGDRVQVQQVVLNLILNAVEAMGSVEAGTRELVINTEQTKTGGVLVAVCDSGPGVDPEHLERVFAAFYTTKSSGTGMGLSICRSIIDAHGGRLWAGANEPRGAVFRFTLPDAEKEIMDPRPAAAHERAVRRQRIRCSSSTGLRR